MHSDVIKICVYKMHFLSNTRYAAELCLTSQVLRKRKSPIALSEKALMLMEIVKSHHTRHKLLVLSLKFYHAEHRTINTKPCAVRDQISASGKRDGAAVLVYVYLHFWMNSPHLSPPLAITFEVRKEDSTRRYLKSSNCSWLQCQG